MKIPHITPHARRCNEVWRECLQTIAQNARWAEMARHDIVKMDGARQRVKEAAKRMDAMRLPYGWKSWEQLDAAVAAQGAVGNKGA